MSPRTFPFLLSLILLCVPAPTLRAEPTAGGAAKTVPEADGIMLPRHRVNLSLPTEARIREMAAEEGKRVKQGEVLSILYTEVEELERDRATAQFKKADFVHKSKLRLKETKSLTELEMMAAEVDLELARIECERSRAELRNKTLTAPWDGQVLRVLKGVGETVNRGEKVIELIDYSTIYVDVYLDAQYLSSVKQGQRAGVAGDAVGPSPVTATVVMIDPVVEPGSGLCRVRLEMPNPELRIATGLPVRVRFEPQAGGR
jgi:membrane fusion protein (multidrug efflux system)